MVDAARVARGAYQGLVVAPLNGVKSAASFCFRGSVIDHGDRIQRTLTTANVLGTAAGVALAVATGNPAFVAGAALGTRVCTGVGSFFHGLFGENNTGTTDFRAVARMAITVGAAICAGAVAGEYGVLAVSAAATALDVYDVGVSYAEQPLKAQ